MHGNDLLSVFSKAGLFEVNTICIESVEKHESDHLEQKVLDHYKIDNFLETTTLVYKIYYVLH